MVPISVHLSLYIRLPWLWRYGTSVFELQEMFPVVVQGLGQFLPLFDAILFQQLGGELLTRRLSGVNGFVVRFTRHCVFRVPWSPRVD